jgi:hypothetical protein
VWLIFLTAAPAPNKKPREKQKVIGAEETEERAKPTELLDYKVFHSPIPNHLHPKIHSFFQHERTTRYLFFAVPGNSEQLYSTSPGDEDNDHLSFFAFWKWGRRRDGRFHFQHRQ